MFELEHELQAWTERFGEHDSIRKGDAEELVQHLRDSITELSSSGLSEEEAFLVATRRIGEPDAVVQEFEKVNNNFGGEGGFTRILQLTIVAAIVGTLVFGLVFASIPYSETTRWLVSVPVWVLGTAMILLVARQVQSLPYKLRHLTCFALSGWTVACVGVSVIASFWLTLANRIVLPPYWIWCFSIVGGIFLAIIPSLLVFQFAQRGSRINGLTTRST